MKLFNDNSQATEAHYDNIVRPIIPVLGGIWVGIWMVTTGFVLGTLLIVSSVGLAAFFTYRVLRGVSHPDKPTDADHDWNE